MQKEIGIFVSNNYSPDLYINIIGYLVYKLGKENIGRIQLISIYDYPFERQKDYERLEKIKRNIEKQLFYLKNGEFNSRGWESDELQHIEPLKIEVNEYFKSIYSEILNTISGGKLICDSIFEENIEDELNKLISAGYGNNSTIFDLTGIAKRYFAEVMMILQEKKHPIYVFEILKNYKEISGPILLHNLSKLDIRYSDINQSQYRVDKIDIQSVLLNKGKIGLKEYINGRIRFWKDGVKNNQDRIVIDDMIAFLNEIKERELENAAIGISNELNQINKDLMNGISPNKEDLAKIRKRLLQIIDKVTEEFI